MSQWTVLAELTVLSVPGNERLAMRAVVEALAPLNLPTICLERLKTAVAEATMNAIEHGNRCTVGFDVHIEVAVSPAAVRVRITDHGGNKNIPATPHPDIDAKLAGEQSPRGWGLFLMRSLVDEVHTTADEAHHTLELVVNRGKDN